MSLYDGLSKLFTALKDIENLADKVDEFEGDIAALRERVAKLEGIQEATVLKARDAAELAARSVLNGGKRLE